MPLALQENSQQQSQNQISVRGRKPGYGLKSIAERNEFIIASYLAGYTPRTIAINIRQQSLQREWPDICERRVQQIIAEHHAPAFTNPFKAKDYRQAQQLACLARLEKTIEKLAVHINNKPSGAWRPFEYAFTMRIFIDAQAKLMKFAFADGGPYDSEPDTQFRVFQRGYEHHREQGKSEAWVKLTRALEHQLSEPQEVA